MANFIYTGVQAGKRISGQISASDPKAAALELRKKKLSLLQLKREMAKEMQKVHLH